MSEHWREEEFQTYLDARGSATERARLDAHLAVCPDCRRQLEELQALRSVLEEWKPVAVSPAFDARLRARLVQERLAEGQPWWRGWFGVRPAYAAAITLAILLAVGVALWLPTPPDVFKPAPVKPSPSQLPPEVQVPPPPSAEGEDLAVLDDPVLMENYDLLEEFDILFDPLEKEKGKTL